MTSFDRRSWIFLFAVLPAVFLVLFALAVEGEVLREQQLRDQCASFTTYANEVACANR